MASEKKSTRLLWISFFKLFHVLDAFFICAHRIIMNAGSSSSGTFVSIFISQQSSIKELIVIYVDDFVVTLAGADNKKIFFCVEVLFSVLE